MDAGLSPIRVKNKFAMGQEVLVGGFRDVMVSVLFRGKAGLAIIGEIQVLFLSLRWPGRK